MVKTQRDPRRMRSRRKASDHLRMPAALARGCQTRLDPLPNRPIALHQDHRSVDPVLARPEPEIPPAPTATSKAPGTISDHPPSCNIQSHLLQFTPHTLVQHITYRLMR